MGNGYSTTCAQCQVETEASTAPSKTTKTKERRDDMNSLVQVFSYEGAEVRTVMIDGEVWFVGKDVATVLGYKNPQEAIREHVDDEDKGVSEILTPVGDRICR